MLLQQGLCDTSFVLGKVAVSDNRIFGDIQPFTGDQFCLHIALAEGGKPIPDPAAVPKQDGGFSIQQRMKTV